MATVYVMLARARIDGCTRCWGEVKKLCNQFGLPIPHLENTFVIPYKWVMRGGCRHGSVDPIIPMLPCPEIMEIIPASSAGHKLEPAGPRIGWARSATEAERMMKECGYSVKRTQVAPADQPGGFPKCLVVLEDMQ